jgi:hypothetical protein
MAKPSSTKETMPEMPAAKVGRPSSRRPPAASGEALATGRGPDTRTSHAEFLDAVRLGTAKLLLEEKRRSDGNVDPSVRRVQYGAELGPTLLLVRWAEDNAGLWQRTEFALPRGAAKALGALLAKPSTPI